jgi:hypothetical protein
MGQESEHQDKDCDQTAADAQEGVGRRSAKSGPKRVLLNKN